MGFTPTMPTLIGESTQWTAPSKYGALFLFAFSQRMVKIQLCYIQLLVKETEKCPILVGAVH
jgi:hypothetical protein